MSFRECGQNLESGSDRSYLSGLMAIAITYEGRKAQALSSTRRGTFCARTCRSVLGASCLPRMPELTVTVADRRDIYVVKVVAGVVQSADPLGFESTLEPGPTFSRSNLVGE